VTVAFDTHEVAPSPVRRLMNPVVVGGLTPLTTVDWPGQLAAVVFTRGCPWRCAYCHNQDLQQRSGLSHPWIEVLAFLGSRQGLLDGVVFSGGEPLLQPGLADALREVRALGFATALHTGGDRPQRLEALLAEGLLDWVGFDIKAPRADYDALTGCPGSGERAHRSLRLLVSSGVPYELRTTVRRDLLPLPRLLALAREVGRAGAGNLVLQPYRDLERRVDPEAQRELHSAAQHMGSLLGPVAVRAA
jgi:pyruvate formate lyase activating enzyme